tara:strand:- start:1443 stop:2663 length:1221 start_codon:yes stop_codon:yes gene_type:complete
MKHFYQRCGEAWFNYPDIYSQVVLDANDNSHFVEVGSWKGMSSVYMAVEIINSKKNIKFDCIDLWGTDPDKVYADKKDLYSTFIKNIKPVKHIINPIVSNSWEAASLYEDRSLDFVWLDAGHEYQDIKKDIAAWYPKVKIGGTIAGHDFTTAPGVSQAVSEYFNKDFKQINTSWLHKKIDKTLTTVNEYFDKVFVINLKERPEKLNDCTKLLNKLNIEFEVYEALDCLSGIPEDYPEKPLVGFLTNKPGAFGCLISHLEVIKIAKKRGYEKILVLEDDIDATKNFLELFSEKIKDLPDDWHLVYLGGSGHTLDAETKVTTKITDHISKTVGTSTTSSYGIHERAYEGILKRNEGPKGIPIDQFYRAYQNIYPCYVMRPNLIWQKAGISDIAHGCFRNYEGFMKEIE